MNVPIPTPRSGARRMRGADDPRKCSMHRGLATLMFAVTAAAAATQAHAQFANFKLYGSLNLDWELISGRQSDGTNPTVNRVSSNSSRFGLRGVEYIGGGWNAIYQLESSVQADTGGSSLGTRETFAGLQGEWGTFKLGKFLTPYDDIHPIFGNAPTLTTSVLSTAALWAQGELTKGQGGFDARLGNSVRYESPTVNGLSAEFQYSTRDASGNADGPAGDNGDHASELRHANVLSLGGFYNNGPIDLGIAYERNYKVRATGKYDDAFSVSGGYDFGAANSAFNVRLGGIYERLKYDTLGGNITRDFYGISATVPVGGGLIYAFWGRANDGKGSAPDGTQVGALAKGPGTASEQWELSYTYNLSLRSLVYVGYVRIVNHANAAYTFNINDYAVAPGGKPSGLALGMAHFF
jgi:predicted porin